jgi:nucleoside-diphosphate kinase
MVIEGVGAVAAVRSMMGATNPLDSAPGTIRGDYAVDLGRNVVHGSDSPGSAAREIAIFFADGELTG